MRKSVGRSIGLFAALSLAAEAQSSPLSPLQINAETLSDKLRIIRAIPLPPHLQTPPHLTPAQWFNWGNCSSDNWNKC